MGNKGNACLLQSINLYNLVEDKFTPNAHINYEKLEELTRLSIRMMSETQEYGLDMQPLEMTKQNVRDWNSIGLGVLGLADMFIALGIEYGSDESIEKVSEIFDKMQLTAIDESANLAKEKGTFGKYQWKYTKESPIIKSLLLTEDGTKVYNKVKKYGMHHGSLLSVAPTGSLSLLLGKLSGGVEPIFRCYYERTTHSIEDGKGGVSKSFKVYSRSIEELLNYNKLPLTLTSEEIKEDSPLL